MFDGLTVAVDDPEAMSCGQSSTDVGSDTLHFVRFQSTERAQSVTEGSVVERSDEERPPVRTHSGIEQTHHIRMSAQPGRASHTRARNVASRAGSSTLA